MLALAEDVNAPRIGDKGDGEWTGMDVRLL